MPHNTKTDSTNFYVYKSRGSDSVSFSAFFHKLVKLKGTVLRNQRKIDVYKKMAIHKKCFTV